jgi:hypothetical protein
MRALSEKDEDLYKLKVDKMWVEPLAISFYVGTNLSNLSFSFL